MKVIGLTGNIGMGKSKAANYFKELGVFVIDTDIIVSDLLNSKDLQPSLINLFGNKILSEKGIDKRAIADIVFNDTEKRIALENLLHPLVFIRIDEIIKENLDKKMFIIEAPLIFERHYEDRFDYVINVFCSNEKAIQRLLNKGYTEQEALRRLNTQMHYSQKNELADFVIDNNYDEDYLKNEVKRIFLQLERITNDADKRTNRAYKD